ncbi:hypothetical protein ANTPLA_LOCUS8072 [Anthophora plagiata]
MSRLPTSIQSVLAAQDGMELEKLTGLADKVGEITPPARTPTVAAFSNTDVLVEQIASLVTEKLRLETNKGRYRSREPSNHNQKKSRHDWQEKPLPSRGVKLKRKKSDLTDEIVNAKKTQPSETNPKKQSTLLYPETHTGPITVDLKIAVEPQKSRTYQLMNLAKLINKWKTGASDIAPKGYAPSHTKAQNRKNRNCQGCSFGNQHGGILGRSHLSLQDKGSLTAEQEVPQCRNQQLGVDS